MKKDKKNNAVVPKAKADVAKKERVRLSDSAKNKIIIFSLVGALLLGAIVISIFAIIDYVKRDPNFDYLTSDLDKYVYLSEEDYRGYKINIDIAKPRDIDVDVVMLGLIASTEIEGESGLVGNGKYYYSDFTIGAADHVFIRYRGYLKDTDGTPIEVSGMCNFTSADSQELTIGSGQFVPGFELNLIGKNLNDFPKFEKITTGKVTDGMVVYVSYTRKDAGSSTTDTDVKVQSARIDLSDPNSVSRLGEDMKKHLVDAEIGIAKNINDVKMGEKTYNYKDFKIDFATTCEREETNGGKPLQIVECYFPYDYGTEGTSTAYLRNETAYFEVYAEKAPDYKAPVLNDEFIKVVVGKEGSPITEAELTEKYKGENLVEKYEAYVKEYLDDLYEEEYRALVEDAMWKHYLAKAEFKKYPGIKVEPIYDEYVEDVYYQFEQTGGRYQDSLTGEYKTYEDLNEFAIAYLGLTYSEDKDWKKTLYTMSESLVGERLIMYYLIDKLNIEITDELLANTIKEVKQEYLDEYIKQSLEYEKKQNPDYKKPTGEEYDKYVEERSKELFAYYDDDYFTETAYYEIALDEFIKLPVVSTLNDRKAYPYPSKK
jgi:FKBP-type peptidyl-prolyl cis-trans isomerase (trigger factor)